MTTKFILSSNLTVCWHKGGRKSMKPFRKLSGILLASILLLLNSCRDNNMQSERNTSKDTVSTILSNVENNSSSTISSDYQSQMQSGTSAYNSSSKQEQLGGHSVMSDYKTYYPKDQLKADDIKSITITNYISTETSGPKKKIISDKNTIKTIVDYWNSLNLIQTEKEAKPGTTLALRSDNDFAFGVVGDLLSFQGLYFILPDDFADNILNFYDEAPEQELPYNAVSDLIIVNHLTKKQKVLSDYNQMTDIVNFISNYNYGTSIEKYDESALIVLAIESTDTNYNNGLPLCAAYRQDGTFLINKICYKVPDSFYQKLLSFYKSSKGKETSIL